MRKLCVILALLLALVVGSVAFAAPSSPSMYFSPGIRRPIVSLLDEAQRSVDVAMYAFTDSELAWAVVRASQRGVEVRVIMDRVQAEGKYAKDEFLARRAVPVKLDKGQGKQGVMHHKFAVIDGATVVTGSYNWTANAEDHNNENALILTDAAVAKAYAEEFERLWEGGTEVIPDQPGQPATGTPAPTTP